MLVDNQDLHNKVEALDTDNTQPEPSVPQNGTDEEPGVTTHTGTKQCTTAQSRMEQSDPVQCDATEEHGNIEKLETNDQPEFVEAFLAELKGKQQIELHGQCVPGTSKDTKQRGFMEAQLV
jgi:hypothetical protein